MTLHKKLFQRKILEWRYVFQFLPIERKKQNISHEFDGLILICDYSLINDYLGDMSVLIYIYIYMCVCVCDYSLHTVMLSIFYFLQPYNISWTNFFFFSQCYSKLAKVTTCYWNRYRFHMKPSLMPLLQLSQSQHSMLRV